jgi:hypothetical protein
MQKYARIYNLTPSVISIHIDEVIYTIMPKGITNPETGVGDNCLMKMEHVYMDRTQAFVLSNPPKIKIIPISKVDNAEEVGKILSASFEESCKKIADFKVQLQSLFTSTINEVKTNFGNNFKDIGNQLDEIYLKLDNIQKRAQNIGHELEAIDVQKVNGSKVIDTNKVKKSAANLFDKIPKG